MKSHQPDWFNFASFLNRHYPALYRLSFSITHDHPIAIDLAFNAIGEGWKERGKCDIPEFLEELLNDIIKDNSFIYRRMQIRKSDSTGEAGDKEGDPAVPEKTKEGLDFDRIHRTILEGILDEMNKIPRKEKLALHRLIMGGGSIEVLAKKMKKTTNALRVRKTRLIASLFSRLSQPGLLLYGYILLTGLP